MIFWRERKIEEKDEREIFMKAQHTDALFIMSEMIHNKRFT